MYYKSEEWSEWERWCLVVSAIFLLFTAYRYCIRGFYRDCFGKSVINLCVSQAMGLLIFESMRDMSIDQRGDCIIRGALAYYFLLVSFFWLSAICIQTVNANEIVADRLKPLTPKIYDSLTYKNTSQEVYENPEKRRTISYFIYAWCTPAMFCLVITPVFLRIFHDVRCEYLLYDGVQWVFIYSIMLVLTAINIYLFVIDADTFNEPGKLLSICNGESNSESRTFCDDEQEPRRALEQVYNYWRGFLPVLLHLLFKANRYLVHRIDNCVGFQLFIVMTVPWLVDMMISLLPASPALDVIQFLNNLRGIWIFVVLVALRTEDVEDEVEENTVYKNNKMSEETEYLMVESRVAECFKYEDV
ncbi:hypothetical protein NE865_04830 [Phthorimaea operculella]|nr:hypothetical protein NE865_04830 [Phthorimaea operculella]